MHGAVVALESAMRTHPGSTASICLHSDRVADAEEVQSFLPGIRVRHSLEVVDSEPLSRMLRRYKDIEFFSALKFFNIQFHSTRPETIVHVDTDTLFFDAVVREEDTDMEFAVEVFPHCNTPYSFRADGMRDLDLAQSGAINGGLAIFYPSAQRSSVIDWLIFHAEHHFYVSGHLGLYADQTWLTLLPFLFPEATKISRDLGVNVAYWNLHERKLSESGKSDVILVNESYHLKMFHFSGYKYPSHELSIHVPKNLDTDSGHVVSHILDVYRSSLTQVSERIPNIYDSRRRVRVPKYLRYIRRARAINRL